MNGRESMTHKPSFGHPFQVSTTIFPAANSASSKGRNSSHNSATCSLSTVCTVTPNYCYTTGSAQARAQLTFLTPLLPCHYESRPANFYQGLSPTGTGTATLLVFSERC